MNQAQTLSYHPAKPSTVYCTQCGRPMRVARQHMREVVACPHCRQPTEPWRAASPNPTPNVQPPPLPPPGQRPGPEPVDARQAAWQAGYSWRNKWVAGTLGILLGCLGVHRFYLGSKGIGLTQLLLSVCSLGVLSPVVGMWGFIEGVLCFCGAIDDADGLPLSG